jgi:DNA recombination protein RmuC
MVAGPTTLASLLNSLQMGFRTLAIEKRTSEVWNVLGKVKFEFGNFENAMKAVQKKLQSASDDVEKVFTRQRVMARALKNVESVSVPVLEEDVEDEEKMFD